MASKGAGTAAISKQGLMQWEEDFRKNFLFEYNEDGSKAIKGKATESVLQGLSIAHQKNNFKSIKAKSPQMPWRTEVRVQHTY